MTDLERQELRQFHNRLAILRSIDKFELEHEEIDAWWPFFRNSPYLSFLQCDDSRQEAIWSAMLKRGA